VQPVIPGSTMIHSVLFQIAFLSAQRRHSQYQSPIGAIITAHHQSSRYHDKGIEAMEQIIIK
jgi:hypothetical protein